MSRARLGLYIFARVNLFDSCFELTPAFNILTKRPVKLYLLPNATYPSSREESMRDQSIVHQATAMEHMPQMADFVYKFYNRKMLEYQEKKRVCFEYQIKSSYEFVRFFSKKNYLVMIRNEIYPMILLIHRFKRQMNVIQSMMIKQMEIRRIQNMFHLDNSIKFLAHRFIMIRMLPVQQLKILMMMTMMKMSTIQINQHFFRNYKHKQQIPINKHQQTIKWIQIQRRMIKTSLYHKKKAN